MSQTQGRASQQMPPLWDVQATSVWGYQLLGGGWAHWVLQAGGPESSSSPSVCQCRRIPSPALGLIVCLPGLLRLPFWYVFSKSHLSVQTAILVHLCPTGHSRSANQAVCSALHMPHVYTSLCAKWPGCK